MLLVLLSPCLEVLHCMVEDMESASNTSSLLPRCIGRAIYLPKEEGKEEGVGWRRLWGPQGKAIQEMERWEGRNTAWTDGPCLDQRWCGSRKGN